jgi:type III restriction enzyme
LRIVQTYLATKVEARAPAHRLDAFLSPYYGWIIERLLGAIMPDTEQGEVPEVPDVDEERPLRTADISVFTPKPVSEAAKTHLNLVVCDTITWEQSAGYQLDRHAAVRSFVKNHGLQFAIPYFHNGEGHEYLPDFVVRLNSPEERYLIAEIKGPDWSGTAEIKAQAAHRWCAAVNATGRYGQWEYLLAFKVSELVSFLDQQA